MLRKKIIKVIKRHINVNSGLAVIKKMSAGLVAFLFLVISSLFIGCVDKRASNACLPSESLVVVIDAGHGGIDGGVSGVNTGVKESDINLEIAKLLAKEFLSGGFSVVMTRSTTAGLYGHTGAGHKRRDMQAREKIIKQANPALVISIHQNKFSSPSRRGAQVFYRAGSEGGNSLAKCVQNQLNNLKENGKKCFPLSGDYYLLNISPCPAIIVECGFLSNAQDEKLLISAEYQKQLVGTIFYGALSFLESNQME